MTQKEVILEGECEVIVEELSLFFQGDKQKSFKEYLEAKQPFLRQKKKIRQRWRRLLCHAPEEEDEERGKEKDRTHRLSHLIDEQSKNPILAGCREMFSNGIDGMGGHIGRFGSGVKQILYYMQKEGDHIHCESQKWCLDIFFQGKTLHYRLSKNSKYRHGMKIVIKSSHLPKKEDVKRELSERFCHKSYRLCGIEWKENISFESHVFIK